LFWVWGVGVQPLSHLQTLPKIWDVLFRYMNFSAGFRISPNAAFAYLRGECAKAPQFDPVTASQGPNDFIEDCVQHLFHIALVQVRVVTCKTEYQFRFDHNEACVVPF
jgi:hypothetical protein